MPIIEDVMVLKYSFYEDRGTYCKCTLVFYIVVHKLKRLDLVLKNTKEFKHNRKYAPVGLRHLETFKAWNRKVH